MAATHQMFLSRRNYVAAQTASLVEKWSAKKLEESQLRKQTQQQGSNDHSGILVVNVLEASGLKAANYNGSSTPYCTISYTDTERRMFAVSTRYG